MLHDAMCDVVFYHTAIHQMNFLFLFLLLLSFSGTFLLWSRCTSHVTHDNSLVLDFKTLFYVLHELGSLRLKEV